jgi:hypothetical protein
VKHLSLTTLSLGLALALGLPAFADTLKKPALDQLVAAHRAKPPPTFRAFLAQAAKANPRLKAGIAASENRAPLAGDDQNAANQTSKFV